ncbi:hypothetical protein [Achromobacter xylosoxidans]|uniref:hypothetical protein n=1 Tax=Alcaligenes xylosoxydans xylosoxydans TaxID=85698 RepID=UPI0012F50BF9|nr:hypothetical protein [Achromobacter xylosoxidans]
MNITPDQHRRWVSSFFKEKVGEFDFFLRSIIECCDQSMRRFRNGEQSDVEKERRIVYSFSAFTNAIQTLKDAGSTFLSPKITWSDIKDLRHGNFMWLSRNAATHDGHPVISAWADGLYYVPNDIERFDSKGELVRIPAPTADVSQFCLEFAKDFCECLSTRLVSLGSAPKAPPNLAEIQHFFLSSSVVPDFARELFRQNQDLIESAISQIKYDPVSDAVESLLSISRFCESRLND